MMKSKTTRGRRKYYPGQHKHEAKKHFFSRQGMYWVCTGTDGSNGCGIAVVTLTHDVATGICPGPKARPTDIRVSSR
jgi:hypothetical protein